MKRSGHWRIEKACLAALLCLGLCAGCAVQPALPAGEGSALSAAAPPPTDELVVYVPPASSVARAMTLAKSLYESRFPDVQLTFKTFGEATDQYPVITAETEASLEFRTMLQAELTAGKGPDLIVFSDQDFPDLYKALESGNFYDLDLLLSQDEAFDPSQYQQAMFNSGYHKGKRLFIPLSYVNYALGATEQTLDAFAFTLTKETTFQEWSEQIISYIQSHSLQENRKLFFSLQGFYSRLFINGCGLTILDYETGAVQVDTPEFRQYMDFYKAIYPCLVLDWEGTLPGEYWTNVDRMNALCSGDLLFYIGFVYQDDMLYNMKTYIESRRDVNAVNLPLPVMEGVTPFATGWYRAGIRNASPNVANAYEFLKILLSSSVQNELVEAPVLNLALQTSLVGYEGREEMYDYLQAVEYRESNAPAVIDLVHTAMLPWIEDQRSYEACLEELKGKLELYLYE